MGHRENQGNRMKLPTRPERDVLASVRKLLEAYGIWHIRMQTGGFRDMYGHNVRFGAKGCADLRADPVINTLLKYEFESSPTGMGFIRVWHIQPLWIETKASGGVQSKAQKFFQQTVESYGHTYLLVKSAAEVQEWLTKYGARGRA